MSPAGLGTVDAQGVRMYGELDEAPTQSDLLNLGLESVSQQLEQVRAVLSDYQRWEDDDDLWKVRTRSVGKREWKRTLSVWSPPAAWGAMNSTNWEQQLDTLRIPTGLPSWNNAYCQVTISPNPAAATPAAAYQLRGYIRPNSPTQTTVPLYIANPTAVAIPATLIRVEIILRES